MRPHAKLQLYWSEDADRPVVSGPRDESEIKAIETHYGVELPEDFRDYLMFACPVKEGMDQQNVEWWAPSRIKNIPDEYEHVIGNAEIREEPENYLFFADMAIWCWAWAINCGGGSNRGRVAIIGICNDLFVAKSFAEFVDLFVADVRNVA
jgi:hypothetical protein